MIDRFVGPQRFLSNFFESKVWHDGVVYPTVEHAFQAAKTLDFEERRRISRLDSAGKAKRAGRNVELRSDWNRVKEAIMFELVLQKFTFWPELKHKLLSTGELPIQEGNTWHDNFWGNCTCVKCRDIPGRNRLGHILMYVRGILRTKR